MGYARERVLDVLKQYGEPMTVAEIAELLPNVNRGTIGSNLSILTDEGRLICIYGRRPYSWVYNENFDPHDIPPARKQGIRFDEYEAIPKTAAVPSAEVAVIDPWERVRMQWRVVFGVTVSADDARLMVELAEREARK